MAVSLAVALCAHPEEGRHSCADDGFSIRFPRGWKVIERFKDTRILAETPDSEHATIIHQNANVVVDDSSGSVDLDDYVESQIISLKRLKGIEFSSRSDDRIDGSPARRFTYRYAINDFGYRAVVYVVKREGIFVVITGISQDENYSSLEPVFNEIAKSLRFI